ncbi:MAG: helix-turn-helix domain-containing protein [bacterium]
MGRKPKYSPEVKVKACTDYISGKKSAIEIAAELNMGKHGRVIIRKWANKYDRYGADTFSPKKHNKHYSKEFKETVVNDHFENGLSQEELALKYDIPDRSTVGSWINKYNSHIELKDYDPEPEVYMANSRKTTYEERIEIVNDCLANGHNIKKTAAKYGCSYSQVRQWVIKFEKDGEEGLADRRGRRKAEEELTDLEKANRRIRQLEREKEELRRKYELLKKAEELERWW